MFYVIFASFAEVNGSKVTSLSCKKIHYVLNVGA